MELVYLWVEEYKNIRNQGFNFSPRFKCEYDENSNELTITENENYVSIFPENINITAIVGENGSGKSSILEQLILLFFNSLKVDTENSNKAWALIYDKKNKWIDINYFNLENIEFAKISINNDIIKQHSIRDKDEKYYFFNFNFDKKEYYNLFYNPSIELVSSSFLNYIDDNLKEQDGAIYDLDFKPQILNIFAFPSKKERIINIKKNENNIIISMYKTIEVLKSKNIELKLAEFFNNERFNFVPSRIDFIFSIEDTEYLIKRDNQKIKDILFPKYYDLSLNSLYAYFIAAILSIADEDYRTKELKEYFFKDGLIRDYLEKIYNEQKRQIPYNDQVSPVYKLIKYVLENIEELIELTANIKLADSLNTNSKSLNADVFETAKLIDVLKTFDNVNLLNCSQYDKNVILKILPVVPSYIRINLCDKNNVYFNDFSYGEKNLINLIYSLIYYIHFFGSNNNTINIYLDEIETGLNPKWQKKLMSILIPFFSNLNLSLNIIISSHSPFILSDLPKENVIFLKKGKQDNPDISQTFGANIHTLLSHGFFMKDGLTGEFAKGKITEIIEILKKEQLSEDEIKTCKHIISIIGEPILQKTLEYQLNEKLNPNETKLQKLQREQQEIQQKIDELTKKKHETN